MQLGEPHRVEPALLRRVDQIEGLVESVLVGPTGSDGNSWKMPNSIPAASDRRVAANGDPVHQPGAGGIVVDREMLRAAIVPERQRAGAPAEAAGELRARGVGA